MEGVAEARAGETLILRAIELEGFKNYYERTSVGQPFGHGLTCVVGANGAGKSVLGEALAFALGGNAKMLRAKALGSLVNNSAAVSSRVPAAEVVIHFEVVTAPAPANQGGTLATSSDGAAPNPGCSVGQLSIRRRVTRSGRSEFGVWRAPVPAASSAAWRPATTETVRAALAPFGIQTEAIDRLVVTQHRQAVAVQDPVRLARFLELLIGSAGYEERLGEAAQQLEQQGAAFDAAEAQAVGLEGRRHQLVPAVAKWQAYEAAAREFEQRQAEVLGQYVGLLEGQTAELDQAAAAVGLQAEATAAAQDAARQQADGLLGQKAAAAADLASASTKQVKLDKQAGSLLLDVAKVRVRLGAAQEAAGKGSSVKQQQQKKKLKKLEREVSQLEAALVSERGRVQYLDAQEADMAARLLAQHSGGDVSVVSLQLQVAAAKQQADAAASRGATLSLKHQQCCGRVEGLQGDAARVAAALQENEAQQQQAETQIQRLRGEADGREKQLRGAATAAERAQQHQGASQAAAQGARAALAAVEAQLLLQQQQREAGTRRGRKGGQGKQSIDEAVAALAAASAAGQLPGLLHGRLHSVARLAHPAAGRAANAALMELCNLSSTLVVADRRTAQAAVDHFKRQQVGVATCQILSEQRHTDDGSSSSSSRKSKQEVDAFLNGTGGTLSGEACGAEPSLLPLRQCVEVAPGVEGAGRLLSHLLSNWHLAADRSAALAAVQAGCAGGRRSIVTMEGEVFKADGEMVGSRAMPGHLRHYVLTAELAAAGDSGAAGPGGIDTVDTAGLQRQQASLQQELERRAQEEQAAGREVAAAAAAVAALRDGQREAVATLAAAERRLQRVARERQTKLEGRAQQISRQLAPAELEAQASLAAAQAAQASRKKAEAEHSQLRQQYEAAVGAMQWGGELLAVERGLAALRAQQAAARDKVAELEGSLGQARSRQQRTQAAQAAAQAAAAEAEQLQQELASKEEEAASKQEAAAALREAAKQVEQQLKQLDKQWKSAISKHEESTKACQQLASRRRELQATRAQKQTQLERTRAALAAVNPALLGRQQQEQEGGGQEVDQVSPRAGSQRQATGVGGGSGAWEGEEEGGEGGEEEGQPRQRRRLSMVVGRSQHQQGGSRSERRRTGGSEGEGAAGALGSDDEEGAGAAISQRHRRRATRAAARRQAVVESSSDSDSDSSDFEAAPVAARRRPAPARQASQQFRRQRGPGAAAAQAGHIRRGPGRGRAGWSAEEVESALAELVQTEAELEAARGAIDAAALEEDLQAALELQQLGAQLDQMAEGLEALAAQREALLSERYARFHSALQKVNAHLSGIYQRLTGGQGDAYCSYPEDRLAAFSEGVAFHTRPDRRRWRPFASLSGGQQALATLALCFALQAAFPSPFFFFDEIDCALDVVNAARVADYLASQGTQALVVSHKPQVYERAECLVGVCASRQDSSGAVTLHM